MFYWLRYLYRDFYIVRIARINKPNLVRMVGLSGRGLVQENVFPVIRASAVSKERTFSQMLEVAANVRDILKALGIGLY